MASETDIELRVFYTWSQAESGPIADRGFNVEFKWDIPLLDGYPYQFVDNVAKRPGPDHFFGLDTPTLNAQLEAWEPDAILVYTWNSKSHLQVMRHFKGRRPVLFRGDSTLIDPRPWWRSALRRAVLWWVYRHIDIAIAVGTNNRKYFAWCGIPQQRIAVAPHSIDTVRFASSDHALDSQASEWRQSFGIGPDDVVILFAGKLQAKKNPDLLLASFKALTGTAHLVFVGSGDLDASLRESAAQISNVHFMSFKNQSLMPAVYRMGDVFVLPSQGPEETWGLALNEAIASARPVIASTRVGGARDLVRSNANGWIFESGDQNQLTSILQNAVSRGRDGLLAMGRVAQSDCEQWSSAASARQIAAACLAAVSARATDELPAT